MNTKILMISSTVFLGLLGVALTFLPEEALSSVGVIPNRISTVSFQILGALYLGFAMLNWMIKGAVIGGKFVNETGYWIPVDASRDDEFTYFNVNQLKASMQTYPESVTHTLVVTDACESGPSFYQAMRSTLVIKNCDDWESTRFKSSQVFSSAGYELAVDNSQFTRTFANMLINNPSSCVPIENIVLKVTSAVENTNQQKPQFGKIAGLEDENGTFFFIPKDF
jgi:hypothetical protein